MSFVPQAKCPTGKRRFLSRADATTALGELIASNLEHPARQAKLGIYIGQHCCGGWHVGHNFKKISERTARRGKHRAPRDWVDRNPS